MRPRSLVRRTLTSAACLFFAATVILLLRPGAARAGGEAREILREPDRVYPVVAGEADASAVVQNPANLGYLRGAAGMVDVTSYARASGARGSGAGIFFGLPTPWKIFSVGAGLQYMWRLHSACPDLDRGAVGDVADLPPGCGGDNWRLGPDERFGKFSLAFALPLMRWLPGVSMGLTYSRLFSQKNLLVADTNQLDLGISWWASRYIALAFVGRGLNQPRLGRAVDGANESRPPITLDPEIALRPMGSANIEVGLGARLTLVTEADAPLEPFPFQPRARLLVSLRGARIFAGVERVAYELDGVDGSGMLNAARISAGVEFNAPHIGIAAGGNVLAGTQTGFDGPSGGSARLRLSRERYAMVPRVRPRQVTRIALADFRGDRGMARAVRAIDRLDARGAQTILIETHAMSYGLAQIEELREAMLRFRGHGGKVVVYMEGAKLSSYFLASAADRVVAHPVASFAVTGFSQRTLYFGDLLSRLGVEAEFVRIAEYKGTPEVYSRDHASGPVAKQREQRLVDTWNHVVRMIARERGRDPEVVSAWVDGAPHRPRAALQFGMVDEVAYRDQLDARLERWLGKAIRIEALPKTPKQPVAYGQLPHVAVLHVDGDLVSGESMIVPILGRRLAGAKTLSAQIKALREDPLVRAVVVRLDTPGGSVAAAEAITRQLDLLAEVKPVVISMGAVAASGGYYIATAGSYVFADATTLTGSIGIFYPKMDLSGLLERFGVGVDIIGLGENATMRSWFKPYGEGERAAAMREIQASYDLFAERVARARGMDLADVDAVARGRVYTGVRAVEVGLVDAYGGLREAVSRAGTMAGMRGQDHRVQDYPPKPTFLQQIRSFMGLRLPSAFAELGAGGAGGATMSAAASVLGLSNPILRVLREIPVALWMADAPEALAMDIAVDRIE